MARFFEIGEIVWWRGKKWEVADHLNGRYLVWSPDEEHKRQPEEWIPEDELAKVR